MVTLYSFIAFFIVGVMWGCSDAFMEFGSKYKEGTTLNDQKINSDSDAK